VRETPAAAAISTRVTGSGDRRSRSAVIDTIWRRVRDTASASGDGGLGSRYVVTARVGLAKVRSPYEVTGYDPPARFAGSGIAGPVRFHEEYSLTADGPVTILTQSIWAIPRGPLRLAEGALRRQLRQLIASDLDRLKNLAEAEIPRATGN